MGLSDYAKYAGLSSFNPTKWHGSDWLNAGLGAATGSALSPFLAPFGPGGAGASSGLSSLFGAGQATAGGMLQNQLTGLSSAVQSGAKAMSSPGGMAMMQAVANLIEQQQRQQQLDNRLKEVGQAFESPENARRLNQMVTDLYETARQRGDVNAVAALGDRMRAVRQGTGARGTAGGSVAQTAGQQTRAKFLGERQQSAIGAESTRQKATDALANLRRGMEQAVRKGQWAPSGNDAFAMQRQALNSAAASVPQGVAASIIGEQVIPTAVGVGARRFFDTNKGDTGGYGG